MDSVEILNQFGVTGPDCEVIAAELGDHPLGLFLLSRYLTTENKTAAQVLNELRLMREDLPSGDSQVSVSIRALLRKNVGGLRLPL